MPTKLTPITQFNGWCAKREDKACWIGLEFPSGAKVRQYEAMAEASPKKPMIVGCSSFSCMQVYVAAAAKRAKVPGIIFVPKRKEPTYATLYAKRMGAELHYVPAPAWTTVLRKRAREHAQTLGKCVRWSPDLALKDTMAQCANLPFDKIKRIVVPTGSGLTAAGVLAGLVRLSLNVQVVAVAVSDLAKPETIRELANKALSNPDGGLFTGKLPPLAFYQVGSNYGDAVAFKLPDGTPLDPYYAAKAMLHVKHGDCLWIPGLRPVSSMPPDIQQRYSQWEGFK